MFNYDYFIRRTSTGNKPPQNAMVLRGRELLYGLIKVGARNRVDVLTSAEYFRFSRGISSKLAMYYMGRYCQCYTGQPA